MLEDPNVAIEQHYEQLSPNGILRCILRRIVMIMDEMKQINEQYKNPYCNNLLFHSLLPYCNALMFINVSTLFQNNFLK